MTSQDKTDTKREFDNSKTIGSSEMSNIVEDLMKDRNIKIICCIFFCFILAVFCVVVLKSILIIIPFALLIAFLFYKLFVNFKLLKNNNIVLIEAVCTNQKQDLINFGINKIYEFEPIDSSKCDKIINLSIPNEDTDSLLKKNQRIKIGYTYYLAFKKNDDKKYSNENFLCFKRSVYNEPESKENKNDSNT